MWGSLNKRGWKQNAQLQPENIKATLMYENQPLAPHVFFPQAKAKRELRDVPIRISCGHFRPSNSRQLHPAQIRATFIRVASD